MDKEGVAVERMARSVRLMKEGVVDMKDMGREMMSSKCLVTDAKISWLLAWHPWPHSCCIGTCRQ